MSLALTEFLAVWGAVLATATFVWNLWKWQKENVHLVIRAGVYENPFGEGILIKIVNAGGRSTEIDRVGLATYGNFLRRWWDSPETEEFISAKHPGSVKVPVMLAPNAKWEGRAPFSDDDSSIRLDREVLLLAGRLYCKIYCSHRLDPLIFKIKPIYADL